MDSVGFTPFERSGGATLSDPQCTLRDNSLHYKHEDRRTLHCGDEREFSFFTVWGRCNEEARENFIKARSKLCSPCTPRVHFPAQPVPKCLALCPCRKSSTYGTPNCTCNYKCKSEPLPGPTSVSWVPAEVIVGPIALDEHPRVTAVRELEKILAKCTQGGYREKRKIAPPSLDQEDPNIDALDVSEDFCDQARSELEAGRFR